MLRSFNHFQFSQREQGRAGQGWNSVAEVHVPEFYSSEQVQGQSCAPCPVGRQQTPPNTSQEGRGQQGSPLRWMLLHASALRTPGK